MTGKSLGLVRAPLPTVCKSVLPRILGFVLLPLFTAVLTPDDYATVNLCTVFVVRFWCAGLQLPSIIGRFYFDCEQKMFLQSWLYPVFDDVGCSAYPCDSVRRKGFFDRPRLSPSSG